MAKLLAADASWESANVCLQTHGGLGFAAEYDVERKFRETRLVPGGAGVDQPHSVVHRRARAGDAEVVLSLPLDGLRVVALEQAVAGAVLLAAAGRHGRRRREDRAPRTAAIRRARYDGALHGESAYFAWLNRGKRSVALDSQATTDGVTSSPSCSRARMCSCTTSRPARSSDSASDTTTLAPRHPRLDLVRHLRLRPGRTAARLEGVRHARAGRGGRDRR